MNVKKGQYCDCLKKNSMVIIPLTRRKQSQPPGVNLELLDARLALAVLGKGSPLPAPLELPSLNLFLLAEPLERVGAGRDPDDGGSDKKEESESPGRGVDKRVANSGKKRQRSYEMVLAVFVTMTHRI